MELAKIIENKARLFEKNLIPAYYLFKMLDSADIVFWIMNEDFKIIYISKKYHKLYTEPRGFTRDDIIGKSVYDIYPRELAQTYIDVYLQDREAGKIGNKTVYSEIDPNNPDNRIEFYKWIVEIDKYFFYLGME